LKTKAEALIRVRSVGTLPWLGFDRAQANRSLLPKKNAAGSPVACYSQGLNIDEPLATLRSRSTSYYEADGLGSLLVG
jgi:hypothetical protein